jgi:hypothetical protein
MVKSERARILWMTGVICIAVGAKGGYCGGGPTAIASRTDTGDVVEGAYTYGGNAIDVRREGSNNFLVTWAIGGRNMTTRIANGVKRGQLARIVIGISARQPGALPDLYEGFRCRERTTNAIVRDCGIALADARVTMRAEDWTELRAEWEPVIGAEWFAGIVKTYTELDARLADVDYLRKLDVKLATALHKLAALYDEAMSALALVSDGATARSEIVARAVAPVPVPPRAPADRGGRGLGDAGDEAIA